MSSLNAIPLSYETPPFPSLYWPFKTSPGEPKYLISLSDIWKFTLYWTLITIPLAHLVVALWAIFMQFLAANERARFLKDHSNFEKSRSRAGERRERRTTDNESDDEYESAREEEETGSSHNRNGTGQQQRHRRRNQSTLSIKNRKLMGASPFKDFSQYSVLILAVYIIIGSIEAFIAGSLVGVVLGAVYTAGYFRMSVWTPLFWGIINMLVLILSSFRISGGM